jgi:molybdopterin converting factor small subunit
LSRIVIKAVHDLARCLGARQQELEIDCPITIDALMQFLVDRHGDELKKKFARREDSLWNVVVFVNGCNVFAGDGLQTLVRENDEVLFLSPISGG